MGPERVINPKERLRGRLPWPKTVFAINVQCILNLFPGFSLFLPGNEVMGFSEPNLWYTLVVYHLHGQTGPFHLPENGREGLNLVSKMALKKWNTNFRLQYSSRKNRTFSDVPLLPEIFSWVDQKSRVPFTF